MFLPENLNLMLLIRIYGKANNQHYYKELRFGSTADRAKQIKTSAKVNEDPTEKLIRELKEENDKLMEMLKKAQAGEAVKISADDDDDDSEGQKEGMSEEGQTIWCTLIFYVPFNSTAYYYVTVEKRMFFFINSKFSFTIYLKYVMLHLFLELADLRKQIEEEIRASVRTT